ncbi:MULTISPECIES: cytochrome P450 [Streptomyces]|uniref:Cytochrome P450 n=1 Tax=Streptomyces rubradiris TaxID=285531 RepID=A0ABQ3RBR7_STRRR|nr:MULTISPECIES: cytochrome P450 [Streptomyces]MDN3265343.1 cytochrome P450 [Streptomyces sp. CSDS2]GHG92267.1 cytochrome P450 [Streptomyces rubradiris]GHI53293.1 cytochrome P450 [Streptomyces rubradiris]
MTTPDAVPLSGPRFQTEPARLYREMRRDHGSVVPVLLDGDIPAWLVLGYRELHQVTGDPVLFSRDSDLWNQWENIPADWPLLPMIGRKQPSILYTVGERHRQRAAMVSNALEAVDPFEMRGHAERFADELIDALCAEGEADLIAQYAMLLPVRVLARLYGFSDEDGPGLVTALNDMIDGRERALAGQAHLAGSMARLVAERRKEPADDVVSRMLADGSGFSDEEIVQDLMVMMAAGHQPTADWIGNSLRLMLTDDRFAASLFGGRNSVAEAMNEVLWEDTPTQNVAGRWAARDTRLGGRAVRAGDLLLLGLQGANSDPQVRTDASELTGGNNAHFSFGHGEHRCPFPAQEVAEVIARTGIEVVLDRLPDIDLAVPADSLTRRPSPWLRGLTRLPVRFSPVPAR